MTEKEIKRNLIAWSSGIKIILGPLDARDHELAGRVREVSGDRCDMGPDR